MWHMSYCSCLFVATTADSCARTGSGSRFSSVVQGMQRGEGSTQPSASPSAAPPLKCHLHALPRMMCMSLQLCSKQINLLARLCPLVLLSRLWRCRRSLISFCRRSSNETSKYSAPAQPLRARNEGPSHNMSFWSCTERLAAAIFVEWADSLFPRCEHGVPSTVRRVLKEGANNGRHFYTCCRGGTSQPACFFFPVGGGRP